MQDSLKQTGDSPRSSESPQLNYAQPLKKKGHSAWSVVGFGIAWVYAIPPAWMWRDIALVAFGGHGSISISTNVIFYSLYAALPIGLCLLGLRRGRKILAMGGIVIAVLGVIGVIIAVRGSPWR